MAAAPFSKVGTKSFKSRADVEAYIEAFNTDEFETYFQYYHPEVHIDIGQIPGNKDLAGYLDWAAGHHQIASETLVPKKIVFSEDGRLVILESWTEFRGRKGVDIPDFFGWGPVADGIGPVIKMIVIYHLDEAGRIKHLEPAAATLMKKATKPDSQVAETGRGFRTKEDIHTYLSFFSANQFDKASQFWAPNLQVHLGPVTVEGREENIKFFSSQRAGGMNEKVVPSEITLDGEACALRCDVTFTAQKDFPEGYFGFGVEKGLKAGNNIHLKFVIFYDLDENHQVKSIMAHKLSEPVIS